LAEDNGKAIASPLILVVEDDEGLNNLLQKKLQQSGFHTEGAVKGKEAIIKAGSCSDLLLVLDYKLPDMSGKELIETLRAKDCYPPFIIVTGQGDEKIAVEMMKLGALDYIIKDSGFTEMLPYMITKSIREIDKEKRLRSTESALKESEQRFKDIFDTAIDGICVLNMENGTINAGNETFCQMLGYNMEELKGTAIVDYYRKDDRSPDKDEFESLLKGETAAAKEIPMKRKDNAFFYADITASRSTWEGKEYLTGIFRDITERKKAREELNERIRELEEFYGMAVGRELKMKELKEEVSQLQNTIAMLKKNGTG